MNEHREQIARALRTSLLAFTTAKDDDDELIYEATDRVLGVLESTEPPAEYEQVEGTVERAERIGQVYADGEWWKQQALEFAAWGLAEREARIEAQRLNEQVGWLHDDGTFLPMNFAGDDVHKLDGWVPVYRRVPAPTPKGAINE